jgi:hypothetical protein
MMPEFDITDKNTGKVWTVVAPDAATAAREFDAWQAAQPKGTEDDPGMISRAAGAVWDGVKGAAKSAYDDPLGTADAAVRGAADAFTFGMADEFAGKMDELTGRGGTYEQNVERERAIDAYDEKNRPWARMAGQAAGGVGQAVLGGSLLGASRLANAGLGVKMGAGALAGGAEGVAYGLGSGEGDLSERAKDPRAWQYGLLGAGLGAAAPAVAKGVGNVAGYIGGGRKAAALSREAGLSPESGRILSQQLDFDGVTPDNLKLGKNTILADQGRGMGSVADYVVNNPNPSRKALGELIDTRAARSGQAVADEFRRAAPDAPLSLKQGLDDIAIDTAPARRAGYEKAFATAVDWSDERLADAAKKIQRVRPEHLREANKVLRDLGEEAIEYTQDEAGAIVFKKMPTMSQTDMITRTMGDFANPKITTSAGGMTATGQAAVGSNAKDIRGPLTKVYDEYGKAVALGKDKILSQKALELGNDAFNSNVSGEAFKYAVKKEVRGNPPALKELRNGMRLALEDKFSRVKSLASAPREITSDLAEQELISARQALVVFKDLSSPDSKAKIRFVFGKEADGIIEAIENTKEALSLRSAVQKGSPTAPRQIFDRGVDEAAAPGMFGTMIAEGERGGLVEGLKKGARTVVAQPTRDEIKKRMASEMGRALMKGGDDLRSVVKLLTDAGMKQETAERVAENWANKVRAGLSNQVPAAANLGGALSGGTNQQAPLEVTVPTGY